jgi:hypothetical protein
VTAREADILLDTLVRHLGLAYHAWERPGSGGTVWRIEAVGPPHRYTVEHPDYAEAALLLAELVGFDVMDG